MNSANIEVFDRYLGKLIFPKYDTKIYPYIEKYGIWQENEFNWLANHIKLGDVCINVGANVGYFSCVMSKLTGIDGFVFAIEANPKFEYYIKENTSRTNMNNVSVIMSAAGDFSGNIDLYINSENCGDNRVFNPDILPKNELQNFSQEKYSISVPIDTIDNIVKTKKVDIVLMDCQGWDHYVIRGMKDIIKKYRPKILMEFIPSWVENFGENPEDVLNEICSYGYNLICYDFDKENIYSPKELISILNTQKLWFTNIYLQPK